MTNPQNAVPEPQIYVGSVMHQRMKPISHRLDYRVFALFLDIDRLDAADRRGGLFGYNRFAPISFHDRDHGPRDGSALRPWFDSHLAMHGLETGGPIRLLCFPRIWGYVFNPLSVYFSYRRDGTLQAILYYVSNTFGEWHAYLLPVEGETGEPILQRADKRFYVSPFNTVDGHYRFKLKAPGERLKILIRQFDADDEEMLLASHTAEGEPLTQRNLAAALAKHPLMTFKVIGGIHWEALKLWRRGLKIVDRPAPPRNPITWQTGVQ